MNLTYYLYKANDGWRWRLKSSNGNIIANGGEAYQNKADALHGISLVKGSSAAPVVETTT